MAQHFSALSGAFSGGGGGTANNPLLDFAIQQSLAQDEAERRRALEEVRQANDASNIDLRNTNTLDQIRLRDLLSGQQGALTRSGNIGLEELRNTNILGQIGARSSDAAGAASLLRDFQRSEGDLDRTSREGIADTTASTGLGTNFGLVAPGIAERLGLSPELIEILNNATSLGDRQTADLDSTLADTANTRASAVGSLADAGFGFDEIPIVGDSVFGPRDLGNEPFTLDTILDRNLTQGLTPQERVANIEEHVGTREETTGLSRQVVNPDRSLGTETTGTRTVLRSDVNLNPEASAQFDEVMSALVSRGLAQGPRPNETFTIQEGRTTGDIVVSYTDDAGNVRQERVRQSAIDLANSSTGSSPPPSVFQSLQNLPELLGR